MPKYIVEREHLIPLYQRVEVEARNPATACRLALVSHDWRAPEPIFDYNGAGPAYVTVIAKADDPAGFPRRDTRAAPSPMIPELHRGGPWLVAIVGDEIGAVLQELSSEDGPPDEIARLTRWRELLRQCVIDSKRMA